MGKCIICGKEIRGKKMGKWEELKEHCKKQKDYFEKADKGAISGIGTHIWQDVLNKMWSLENKKAFELSEGEKELKKELLNIVADKN